MVVSCSPLLYCRALEHPYHGSFGTHCSVSIFLPSSLPLLPLQIANAFKSNTLYVCGLAACLHVCPQVIVCVCGGVYLKTICRSWFSSAVWLPGAGLRSSGSRTNTFTDSATSLAHHCHFDSAFYTDFRLVYLLTSLKGYTEELH